MHRTGRGGMWAVLLLAALWGSAFPCGAWAQQRHGGTAQVFSGRFTMRPGNGQSNRLINDGRRRPVNTPVDVGPGTRASFRGEVQPDRARAVISFSRPVGTHNGLAFMHAVPNGQDASRNAVDGALGGVGRLLAGRFRAQLARRGQSLLERIPIKMTELRLELQRGRAGVEHVTVCRAKVFGISVPVRTCLRIPVERMSPHMVQDVGRMLDGDHAPIKGFLREVQRQGLFGSSLPDWARQQLAR